MREVEDAAAKAIIGTPVTSRRNVLQKILGYRRKLVTL
jgi:hypothetical protein